MMKNDRYPLSQPERADNAEESVKCPYCGTMIHLGYDEDEEVVTCPVCQEQVTTVAEDQLYSSNEDY
ncbi:MAG: formate dehydrogenase accessory protein FdhE [Firmicutes bacterium]|nr:formate dehydrogenase accessory protein FdhE [Bacillota bacterium]